jgi:Copper transport outer membrane protein, MctB
LISFRYHLVSIVAVFLALALGVVVGTTVVNQGIIDDLRSRTAAAAKRADDARTQIADLKDQLATDEAFQGAVLPLVVAGQLTGTTVVLVTQQDADPAAIDAVRRVFEQAGATIAAELVVTDRMALSDAGSTSRLAGLLALPVDASPEDLAGAAAAAVGSRLAIGAPTDGSADVIGELQGAGFMAVRGVGSLGELGGSGQAMVVIAAAGESPAVDPALFLRPLVSTLVGMQETVAAAETLDATLPFVTLLRQDGAIDGKLLTVDDADRMQGRVSLVLGLHDLVLVPGDGGDYGEKDGASSLVPSP